MVMGNGFLAGNFIDLVDVFV